MRLKYVVLTSVNRDDLPDGGAAHFAACVRAIKAHARHGGRGADAGFQGVLRDVETVVDSGLEVFAQNVETVRRLTHPVRDPRAGYEQTLAVLAHAKRHRPAVLTKTSLMLGLGETEAEIAHDDGRPARRGRRPPDARPVPAADGPNHLPVDRFVTPEQFDRYRECRDSRAASANASPGPLVRSSYRAEQALNGNNAGRSAAIPMKTVPSCAKNWRTCTRCSRAW
jgi:lipoic acid synthetase